MQPRPLYAASQRLGPLVEEETFARLYRSREFLANHFDRRLRLSEAAGQACLSPFHYHRMFVRAFGETPHEFLTRRRMDRAKELLARDECPVTEVCLAVGYESLGSFSSLFRSAVGRSPLEYRKALRRVFPVPNIAPHRFIPACFLVSFGSRPF
ncbi:MAG TPA: AraC family transcriptional regulator [Bryobacteraceae bacterium]|jgi:AraC-like DNA-binding protein|nr:AraC family transcriptional regulator [Bryobacteraceae bacterium]